MPNELSCCVETIGQTLPEFGSENLLQLNVIRAFGDFIEKDEGLKVLFDSFSQIFRWTVDRSGMYDVGNMVNQMGRADWNILGLATETKLDLENIMNKAAECVAEQLKG